MPQRISLFAPALVALTLIPSAAQATPITFDFELETATNGPPVDAAIFSKSITKLGETITITRENNAGFDIQGVPPGFAPDFGTRVLSPFRGGDDAFVINLSVPTYFFSIDLTDLVSTDTDTFTVQAYSQANLGGSLVASASQTFAGVTPDVGNLTIGGPNPVLSFRISDVSTEGGHFSVYLDNLVLDTAAPTPVPEPASLVLLASGVAGAAWRRRHQR